MDEECKHYVSQGIHRKQLQNHNAPNLLLVSKVKREEEYVEENQNQITKLWADIPEDANEDNEDYESSQVYQVLSQIDRKHLEEVSINISNLETSQTNKKSMIEKNSNLKRKNSAGDSFGPKVKTNDKRAKKHEPSQQKRLSISHQLEKTSLNNSLWKSSQISSQAQTQASNKTLHFNKKENSRLEKFEEKKYIQLEGNDFNIYKNVKIIGTERTRKNLISNIQTEYSNKMYEKVIHQFEDRLVKDDYYKLEMKFLAEDTKYNLRVYLLRHYEKIKYN
jgi:hypothetical protein